MICEDLILVNLHTDQILWIGIYPTTIHLYDALTLLKAYVNTPQHPSDRKQFTEDDSIKDASGRRVIYDNTMRDVTQEKSIEADKSFLRKTVTSSYYDINNHTHCVRVCCR